MAWQDWNGSPPPPLFCPPPVTAKDLAMQSELWKDQKMAFPLTITGVEQSEQTEGKALERIKLSTWTKVTDITSIVAGCTWAFGWRSWTVGETAFWQCFLLLQLSCYVRKKKTSLSCLWVNPMLFQSLFQGQSYRGTAAPWAKSFARPPHFWVKTCVVIDEDKKNINKSFFRHCKYLKEALYKQHFEIHISDPSFVMAFHSSVLICLPSKVFCPNI